MQIKLSTYFLPAFIYLLFSCSEGDVIDEVTIDFNGTLSQCANLNNYVFYKINSEQNKILAVNFTSTTFSNTPAIESISTTDPTIITLNNSNQVLYREFNAQIDDNTYFCSSIPPSSDSISRELTSIEGTLEIQYEELDSEITTERQFNRTFVLKNITLFGDEFSIRQESLTLGNDRIIISL